MRPPLPPEEIAQLMQFITAKTKNVTSPMNIRALSRQFKEKTGSSVAVKTLASRIDTHRLKIHKIDEFDTETKVKMLFALSAPVNAGFLEELKKVADVEVDDLQRIIRYEQKDGGLELRGKHSRVSMKMEQQRNREMIQFLAEKSETVDTPIVVKSFLREFKEKTGCTESVKILEHRYQRVSKTIYQSTGIDGNTKIKMMFISNAKLSEEILKKLRKNADVEVDKEGRITKYKSKDGSLELEGSHGKSNSMKSFHSNQWRTIYQNAIEKESEENEVEDTNCQKDNKKTRIDLVRFLINRTKNATLPLSIKQLATDYQKEFKSYEPLKSTESRIRSFRQRILEMNHFDKPTKVKLAFAVSVPIDAKFLKELQKDAIVKLDEKQRIKKYRANDGSLELEGDHSRHAKLKAGWAQMKKRRIVNDSSKTEDDGDKKDSSESDGSDEEEEDGENVGESTRSNQTPTSSSARKNDRLQKSTISLRNKNKKKQLPERNSDFTHTRNHTRMSREKKRARISSSTSETSEEDDSEMNFDTKNAGDPLNDEENLNDIPVERKPESLIDTNNSDEFDFDPSNYELDTDHLPIEKKPESLIEVNTEESSTTIVRNHYEENFFECDPPIYKDDMEHIPEEKKPESLLEVKTELPDGSSTSNFVYHYEDITEQIPIKPKQEII